ncbi:MAG: ComF family protein [Deltaproteobacteria bacterium]|nr:ComF family protein [Deltaproteobacteria bacterium]
MRPAARERRVGPGRRSVGEAILDAILPPSCMLCAKLLPAGAAHGLCADCRDGLVDIHPPLCRRCGMPFLQGEITRECGDCSREKPAYDMLRAPYLYTGALRRAILQFKFERQTAYTRGLAGLLATVHGLGIDLDDYDLAMPVPLHRMRLRRRGYNQALLLGRRLLARVDLPLRHDVLARVKNTTPQPGLSMRQRRLNVKDAFQVLRPDAVVGRKVLLIDDIVTTGATMDACAKALKAAGAERVDGIAVARPPGREMTGLPEEETTPVARARVNLIGG